MRPYVLTNCVLLLIFASTLLVSLKTQSINTEGFAPLLLTLNLNIVRDYKSLKPFVYVYFGINFKKSNYLFGRLIYCTDIVLELIN